MQSQSWLDSIRRNRNKSKVKKFGIATSFVQPNPGGKGAPVSEILLRVSIRPYGSKQCSTDIKVPRGSIRDGRIQVPPGDEYMKKLREEADEVERMAHRAFMSLKLPHSCPTPRQVIEKMKILGASIVVTNSFNQCVDEFRASKKEEWSANTEKFLDNALAALRRFMKKELFVEEILLHEMNEKFLTRFQLWMKRAGEKTGKGLAPESVYQYMLKICQVLEFAYYQDYISTNPCDKFSISQPKAENAPDQLDRKVSVADQQRLESTQIFDERLERGRLLILLQTWTGFCYEDMVQNHIKNCIQRSLNGEREIRYNRQKTGELALIPLFKETEAILEKLGWNNNPGQYRTYLRLVEAVFAHFGILLNDQDGTHVPRHIFGNRMLEKGFTMESVSRMMGHGSVRITEEIYAKVNSDKIQADYTYVKKREAI